MSNTSGPDRALIIGAALVALIVVAAAIVALVGREPAQYGATTPEGTAQRYVQAVLDGDRDVVNALLVDESCRNRTQDFFGREAVTVRLLETNVTGSTATVDIEITHGGGNPLFGGYGWEEVTTIRLEQTDSGWGVSGDSWPFFICEVGS